MGGADLASFIALTAVKGFTVNVHDQGRNYEPEKFKVKDRSR